MWVQNLIDLSLYIDMRRGIGKNKRLLQYRTQVVGLANPPIITHYTSLGNSYTNYQSDRLTYQKRNKGEERERERERQRETERGSQKRTERQRQRDRETEDLER